MSVLVKAIKACLLAVVISVFAIPAAMSQPNQPYLDWFAKASPHLRTAITYLRTGNGDFAALALEDLTGLKPAATTAPFTELIATANRTAKSALDQIDNGNLKPARAQLMKLREQIFAAHRAAGYNLFADCIWDLTKKGPAIWTYRRNKPDLGNKATAAKVSNAAKAYLAAMNACDKIAPKAEKAKPEYQRLITTARTSLQRISTEAVPQKNGGLLFRFIIELRAIDRLFLFHFS